MEILQKYHRFKKDFNKAKAGNVPPHRPYDCNIEFMACMTLAWNCPYPLSLTENKVTEQYIEDAQC